MNKNTVGKESLSPDELRPCQIEIRGQVAGADLNASSPLHLTVEPSPAGTTLLSLRTDPSGLIGLLRYLLARSHILLSVHYG